MGKVPFVTKWRFSESYRLSLSGPETSSVCYFNLLVGQDTKYEDIQMLENQNKIRRWVRGGEGNARVANKDSFPTYICLLQTKVSCHVRVEEQIAAVHGKI